MGGWHKQQKTPQITAILPTEEPEMSSSKLSLEELADKLDWKKVEADLSGAGFKVTKTAESFNARPKDLRELVIKKYGDKIVFKRGRNGGAFLL